MQSEAGERLLDLVLLLLPFVLGFARLFPSLLIGLILRHALLVLDFPQSGFFLRLRTVSGRHAGWWVRSLVVLVVVSVHRVLVAQANRHRVPHVLAEDDDGGLGAGARWLSVRIVGLRGFAVLVSRQRAGTMRAAIDEELVLAALDGTADEKPSTDAGGMFDDALKRGNRALRCFRGVGPALP